jgi:hypothetical protein
MTKTIVLLLVAGLAVATAIWWIRVDAQPVTVAGGEMPYGKARFAIVFPVSGEVAT